MEEYVIRNLEKKVDELVGTLQQKRYEIENIKSAQKTQQQLEDSNVDYHKNNALEQAVQSFQMAAGTAGGLANEINRTISELERKITSLQKDKAELERAKSQGGITNQYSSGENYILKNINLYNQWKNRLLNKLDVLNASTGVAPSVSNLESRVSSPRRVSVSLDEQLNYTRSNYFSQTPNYQNQPAWITEIQYAIPNYRTAEREFFSLPSYNNYGGGNDSLESVVKNYSSNPLPERVMKKYQNSVDEIRKLINLNFDGKYGN